MDFFFFLSLFTLLPEARSLPELRAFARVLFVGLFWFSLIHFSARMVAGKSQRVSHLCLLLALGLQEHMSMPGGSELRSS